MPTYQYRCKECGHDLEVVQSFHDDALTTCPECQGPLKKVYGNVGISFKGSGFYKTDSRSSGGSSGGPSGGSSSSSSGGGSGSSNGSDAKADKKTETASSTSSSD